jgi:hypothetical protein
LREVVSRKSASQRWKSSAESPGNAKCLGLAFPCSGPYL